MRITKRALDAVCNRINELTGNSVDAWTRVDGRNKANIGTYYIDKAYGGNKLVQICNDGGAINEITYGFVSKRELYNMMQAYLRGLETNKEGDK